VDTLDTKEAAKTVFSEMDDKGNITGGLALRWLEAETSGLFPRTQASHRSDLKNPAEFFRGRIVRNITRRDVEDWKIHRLNSHVRGDVKPSPLTFNRTLGHVRRIFDYAVTHGLRLDNPAVGLTRAKVPKKPVDNSDSTRVLQPPLPTCVGVLQNPPIFLRDWHTAAGGSQS